MRYIYLDEVDSTNNYLKERAEKFESGTVVAAEKQTAGKGRRGHSWTTEGCLAMSVLLKNMPDESTLTARVGLAVCEAIDEAVWQKCSFIKWPNDVIIEGHKVCGILCESTKIGDSFCVVCGIGVNISQDERFFAENNIPNGGSIKMLTNKDVLKNTLCELIAGRVVFRGAERFEECFEEYEKRVLNIGKTVKIITKNGEETAKALGLSKSGSLICRNERATFEISSGEVSLRGENGYI